ncbi:MAG: MazG-like family protein, partial [Erysipelotrichaceae bacterium]
KKDVCDELADVVNYCILLADKLDVRIEDIVLDKLEKNAEKYPIDKAKGTSSKYNKL